LRSAGVLTEREKIVGSKPTLHAEARATNAAPSGLATIVVKHLG